MPNDVLPNIPSPPDASEVHDWSQHGPDLLRRPFVGTVREAAGFRVRVEGIQRENGSCLRRAVVEAASLNTQLAPEALRQLVGALSAAAAEIEARR